MSKDRKAEILNQAISIRTQDLLAKCDGFKTKSGTPKINGNVVVFEQQPSQDAWDSKKADSTSGECLIAETEEAGLNTPENINDIGTLVVVYPTYSRTGQYTSGTGAYSKKLYVQVYDLEKQIAYEPVEIDSASAPQSFSYYAGSAPDKYSGETDVSKVFDYLKKL